MKKPSASHPAKLACRWPKVAALAASGLALSLAHPSPARAQAVWSNGDDRDYSGNPPVFAGAFWSYGYVAPDQNGNGGHAGNWSGNLVPGQGGPVDVILDAPGNTLCDVTVTLNSLTIQPGGALSFYRGQTLTVAHTNFATDGTMVNGSTYTNTGTLTKSAGTGTYAFDGNITLNSTLGTTIASDSGVLQLPGGSGLFDTVTFDPAAGAVIDLVSEGSTGTFTNIFQGTLTNGAGTGTVQLSGGTMAGTQRYINNPQPCVLAFTGSVFQWIGGNIGNYQQGAIFTNTGVVNISGGATKETDAVFTNNALVIQSGAGQFNVGDYHSGGSFTNAAGATYDLQSDAAIG